MSNAKIFPITWKSLANVLRHLSFGGWFPKNENYAEVSTQEEPLFPLVFHQWFADARDIMESSLEMAVGGRHYYRSMRFLKESSMHLFTSESSQ